MKGRRYLLLASIAMLLAIAMNFYLYSYDRHHPTEILAQVMNHTWNIALWFGIFTTLIAAIGLLILLVKAVINKVKLQSSN